VAKWLRSMRQPTTYLGVAVIVIIWGGIWLLASQEHERAYQEAVRQGGNLTRVLEEYVRRVAQQSDRALLTLRRDYRQDPQHFDLASWASQTQAPNDLAIQFGIANADGFVIQSSRRQLTSPIYIGDRAHFKIQRDATTDALYISEPLVGHISGRLSLQFTRRLVRKDGSFDGVVASALDIRQLEDFFGSLDIGHGGVVSIVGTDTILRARGGPNLETHDLVGTSLGHSPLFDYLQHSSTGHYWNTTASSARFDGISRLIFYRTVSGLPLIAVVGLSEEGIFQQARSTLQKYLIAGLIVTAIALIVLALGAARQAQILAATGELERSKHSLEQSNLLLQTALKNMAHGMCMFDRQQRLVVCNEMYGQMYGLVPEQTKPGTTLRSILEARVAAGNAPENADDYVRKRLDEVAAGRSYYAENKLGDGRVYAVTHRPMPDGGWVAMHVDITEQRRAEQALDETKHFLDSIIENIPVAVVVKDAKTRKYVLVNRAFETMVGLPRSDLLGRTAFDVHRINDAQKFDDADTESLRNNDRVSYKEIEADIPLRGPRTQATSRIVIKNGQGDPKFLIAVIDDVTERKKAEQRITFLAHHDALTGLANRAAFAQKIEEAAARQRRQDEPFTLLLLDLDRFKQVNDTLGHLAGDALLVEVATRLKPLLRETDVFARLGGDEFAIIQVGERQQRDAARSLADRVIEIFGKPFDTESGNITIGVSIGIAQASDQIAGFGDLLKMADLALYRAKSIGRNGYCFFDPEMSVMARARHEIESDLRRAIQQNEFEVHYQPIVDANTRKIHSMEALVRWRHPTKGLIFPNLFIPLAEETGLITQIGDFVLRMACAEAAKWPAGIKLAVNLSIVQFHNRDLPDVIMRALVDFGLRPEQLELEITETALIESAAECIASLRQLKDLGVTIVLDDFGTGYSSLSQLTMFPFDKIKIDKSFTQNLTKRSECAAIIAAVLTLARSLDIATTAEGVETVDQYRLLRLAGVTLMQGHLFKRPGPASEINFDGVYGKPANVAAA
jgi:diguanylate cyclase (GGDEF)-like protein/PAS domain S-box-containing protein